MWYIGLITDDRQRDTYLSTRYDGYKMVDKMDLLQWHGRHTGRLSSCADDDDDSVVLFLLRNNQTLFLLFKGLGYGYGV